jgi:Zn-dependent protease
MENIFSPLMIISLIILVYSAILHEIAHGYVADRLGDPTARLLGRITLNPIPHIDPFFTILLPFLLIFTGSPILIGGAKPVPLDPFNLKEGRKDIALVSLAGPMTNLLLAVGAAGLLKLLGLPFIDSYMPYGANFLAILLSIIIKTNLSLAVFNLLPIPPLDGSKVFSLILPENLANSYLAVGQFGIIILFIFLMSPSSSLLIATIYGFLLGLLGLS